MPANLLKSSQFGSVIAVLVILLLSSFIQFSVITRTEVEYPLRADAGQYFLSAYNLSRFGTLSSQNTWQSKDAAQQPLPDALRPPGYSLFLVSIGNLEPTAEFVSRVCRVQAILAVLSVWLLFLIASTFLPRGWSHMAALLGAIDPHLAVMSTYVLTETLFTFLLFGSVYCLLRAVRSRHVGLFFLTGILFGLCGLTRPTLHLLPVLALAIIALSPRLREWRKGAGLVLIGFLVVMSPSFLRNHWVPQNAPQSNLQANFLLHGSYPGFMYQGDPTTFGVPYRFDPRVDGLGNSTTKTFAYIVERFRDQPAKYLNWYLIGKPGYFLAWANVQGAGDILVYPVLHSPYLEEPGFVVLRRTMRLLHWPLMMLGMAGVGALWWRRQEKSSRRDGLIAGRLVSLVVIYALALHMIGAPFPRYGIPFRPLLYPLALFLVYLLWDSLKQWRDDHGPGLTSPVTK